MARVVNGVPTVKVGLESISGRIPKTKPEAELPLAPLNRSGVGQAAFKMELARLQISLARAQSNVKKGLAAAPTVHTDRKMEESLAGFVTRLAKGDSIPPSQIKELIADVGERGPDLLSALLDVATIRCEAAIKSLTGSKRARRSTPRGANTSLQSFIPSATSPAGQRSPRNST